MNYNIKCAICRKKKKCKKILKKTFTDLDYLQGRFFCKNCIKLFNNKWLKTSFYWTKKNKRKIKQNQFYNLINNLKFPCLISFSESKKKHRLFRSKWSINKNKVYISLDNGNVILNLNKDLKLLNYLQKFYLKYNIQKKWLLNIFPIEIIKKIGFKQYLFFLKKTKYIKQTKKYKFFIKILNKNEKKI